MQAPLRMAARPIAAEAAPTGPWAVAGQVHIFRRQPRPHGRRSKTAQECALEAIAAGGTPDAFVLEHDLSVVQPKLRGSRLAPFIRERYI
jgi:hypothetical protein